MDEMNMVFHLETLVGARATKTPWFADGKL